MATLTLRYLPDGSVKGEVHGEVEMEVHDLVESSLDDLARALGGPVTRESLGPDEEVHHHHGPHSHVHAGGRGDRGR